MAIESANMVGYSARQAVQKVGIGLMTLERYLAAKQFPAPEIQRVGGVQVRLWSDKDIEGTSKILPKVENGRMKEK